MPFLEEFAGKVEDRWQVHLQLRLHVDLCRVDGDDVFYIRPMFMNSQTSQCSKR